MPAAEPLTITDAAPLIRSGQLTPSDLLEQCLVRIDRYEPHVKAWVYLDRERARREAAQLTDEIKKGQYRGPLHGIPVGIKDIIDVFDMPTGCGSKLWANSYARRDATCVERLRQAGALVLGKTVTTPYAYLDPPPTRNPWNLDRTPGGSSSGSAAAVACGMCLAALGTQTGGSLTRPASYCGVYSLKPTHARVSTAGVLPLAPQLDHIGVMANCVRDLAEVFQVIAGYDPASEYSRKYPVRDCVRAIEKELAGISKMSDDQNRKRFLQPTEMIPERLHPDVAAFMKRVAYDLHSLSYANYTTVDAIRLPPLFAEVHRSHRVVMAEGAARVHSDRFARRPDEYPPRIRDLIEEGLRITTDELQRAGYVERELYSVTNDGFPHPFLIPATLDPAPTPETTGDAWCNSPWSLLGVPTVSLPLGRSSDGLPLSIQLIGDDNHEDYLLAQAAWVEEVFWLSKVRNTQPRYALPPVPG